ncbi:MAG: hypothetical protein RLZZ299_3123 [Pseudomonadota bacterium]|jgi:hypothetical protein
MTRRWILALSLLGALGGAADAHAKDTPGVNVRVVVKDTEAKPIPTAVVRHPQEQDRHRVNAVDGSWEGNALYMPDGSELRFTAGMTLELEISAPGYVSQVCQYQVRKRKNVIEVKLDKLVMDTSTIEEPVISFGRDEPREVSQ